LTPARRALRLYLDSRAVKAEEHLFVGRADRPMTVRGIQKLVGELARRAKLAVRTATPR
jgi:site-specific recombinase XerC